MSGRIQRPDASWEDCRSDRQEPGDGLALDQASQGKPATSQSSDMGERFRELLSASEADRTGDVGALHRVRDAALRAAAGCQIVRRSHGLAGPRSLRSAARSLGQDGCRAVADVTPAAEPASSGRQLWHILVGRDHSFDFFGTGPEAESCRTDAALAHGVTVSSMHAAAESLRAGGGVAVCRRCVLIVTCGQCRVGTAFFYRDTRALKTGWAFACSGCGSWWAVARTRTDLLKRIAARRHAVESVEAIGAGE